MYTRLLFKYKWEIDRIILSHDAETEWHEQMLLLPTGPRLTPVSGYNDPSSCGWLHVFFLQPEDVNLAPCHWVHVSHHLRLWHGHQLFFFKRHL